MLASHQFNSVRNMPPLSKRAMLEALGRAGGVVKARRAKYARLHRRRRRARRRLALPLRENQS